jgi:hypothetical protein
MSTVPGEEPVDRLRRSRTLRRVALACLFVFLAAGLAGAFGVRTREASASNNGYELTVTFATVTRPGLATPWSVDVRRSGGFDGPITIAASSDYLDMFDENGLDPEPSSSTADPEFVVWEFEPPAGDTLSVSFDARIEPAKQWGRSGVVKVLAEDAEVVQASFRTWVMP